MSAFPEHLKFIYPWRPYQQRVLESLETYIQDGHLHIVAAPGSGKTVLGLEAMLRVGKKTLVLAPTIALRTQWLDRFQKLFCADGFTGDWISCDVQKPALLTVDTYQGLYAACTGIVQEVVESEEETEEQGESSRRISADAVAEILNAAGVETLIVDECHHLRAEWWKCLTLLKSGLKAPVIIALTATPPFDVSPQEWDRYTSFCGPVDEEISVPELVKDGTLAPHQDYICYTLPADTERQSLLQLRLAAQTALDDALEAQWLRKAVAEHPWVVSPKEHEEAILETPEIASAMAVYVNTFDTQTALALVELLGQKPKEVPQLTLVWLEILLNYMFYSADPAFEMYQEEIETLRKHLSRGGLIHKRRLRATEPAAMEKLLVQSVSKLDAIRDIALFESGQLNEKLRMVVLTDYIRKDDLPGSGNTAGMKRIGVVPIFETLRLTEGLADQTAAISGSMVILPDKALPQIQSVAEEYGIDLMRSGQRAYSEASKCTIINITDQTRPQMVAIMTESLRRGFFRIMVGTKALLGEGWDAPYINTLVLATVVGTFVQSNQLRGRAIRRCPEDPDKTANIWHLCCLEPDAETLGIDFDKLRGRMEAFVGPSETIGVICNGIHRLHTPTTPVKQKQADELNAKVFESAAGRNELHEKWQRYLQSGTSLKYEVTVPDKALPRRFITNKTLLYVAYEALSAAMYIFFRIMDTRSSDFISQVIMAAALAMIVGLPGLVWSLVMYLRHGTVEKSMKQVGEAILDSLQETEILHPATPPLKVDTMQETSGVVGCWLVNGTAHQKQVFRQCLEEFLGPVENPRYLLLRKGNVGIVQQKDYHAIPTPLGTSRERADVFMRHWGKRAGRAELIYTRTGEGRRQLLKARQHSLSAAFTKKAERRSIWR